MRFIPTLLSLATLLLPQAAIGGSATETLPAARSTAAVSTEAAGLFRNARTPFDGILTGGQPTVEQFETLAALGYRTVINLRGPDEVGSTDPVVVESLGMAYVSIPITDAGGITEENARKLTQALEGAEYPVVTHCASGNRVGALFALKAYFVDGETATDALAIGRAAGTTRLEPLVRQRLGLE